MMVTTNISQDIFVTVASFSITTHHEVGPNVNCTLDEATGMSMAVYGILPVAGIGIVGNAAAFWVWDAETSFSATPFLFKWLAMCDILYLAFNFAFVILLLPCCYFYTLQVLVTHVRNVTQIMSVHTTLLVAITRWMAVCMPLRVGHFLTKRCVAACCLGLAVWCLAIEIVEVTRKHCKGGTAADRGMVAVHEVLGYVLPWSLLLLFSLHLLWTTRRQFRASHVLHEDSVGPDDERFRRLTLTVLCVALSSFVAYPIGVTVEMVLQFKLYRTCQGHRYYDILATLGGLLQVLNATINIGFYWAFVSRFRELLRQRLSGLRLRDDEDQVSFSNYTVNQRLSVTSASPYLLTAGSRRHSQRTSLISITAYGSDCKETVLNNSAH